MTPFFSVIIPLYNKENFIENTINSVLKQSFQDYEIIVVNDCSTDKSVEKVLTFASPKIKLINHTINKGLSATRNTGIKNAKANYIAFLDADDIWKPLFLEEIYSLITNFPEANLFASNYVQLYPNLNLVLPITKIRDINFKGIIEDFFEKSLAQPLYCPSSLCVEKGTFEIIGSYNEKITFGEDIDFNIRANNQLKLAYLTEPLVTYTMYSENQITNTSLKNKIITNFDYYEKNCIANKSLKKYLDFNRYIMAKSFKLENDIENFKKMKKGIDANRNISGLNYLQIILLNCPTSILKFIKKVKILLIKKGIRIATYS